MTTEDDFQRALDRKPGDWQTRLVFADWLQERDDPRAEGYRALGLRRAKPTKANYPKLKTHYWVIESQVEELITSFKPFAETIRAAVLPKDWCRKIFYSAPKDKRSTWNSAAGWYCYAKSRRAADDAAAIAFSKLPAERRAALLNAEPPIKKKPKKPAKKRKSKK